MQRLGAGSAMLQRCARRPLGLCHPVVLSPHPGLGAASPRLQRRLKDSTSLQQRRASDGAGAVPGPAPDHNEAAQPPAPAAAPAPALAPAPAPVAPASSSFEDRAAALCGTITSLFPLWVVLAAALALARPEAFTWLPTPFITWGLALTMLGMGLTMRLADFADVFRRMPGLLLLGMGLQYTVMPGLGWLFSRYAGLPAPLAVGIAVLSACPGGTASNIVAFLARGEMALSILMTAASTLAAVVATPAITAALAGTLVPVDAKGLFMSTMQVVLLPVMAGCVANQQFPAVVARVARFTPAVATLLVAAIVGSTLAASAGAVRASGPALLGAVAGLHASGFLLGFVISKALGLSGKVCRTMSIEVGMQNSTLGAVLAALHFADPLTAAPCAVSACTHSVMGSALAAYWRRTTRDEEQQEQQQREQQGGAEGKGKGQSGESNGGKPQAA
ncbi:hypothetical protein HYH02_005250 [Chlamydomonas schloesseri]|uniref:Uncharacterized protein n=1 Tax=Chlamydomonas schloesseri TaxID=2026947 RepID=A0A836B7H2_9CHLO|nr:hypothetical protein HYH02_005250 [Chlamydomonas schloesseri]|eukprot:KAG2449723.1 hypothetical protein HYH02_005250 [Chlamydomonas schloesseri]